MIALIPRVPQRLAYALSRLAQGSSAAVPSGKNMSDTVKLLALMVRFVVVDVTDPQSAPYEIGLISMLNLRSTPVVPLIQGDQKPFAMLEDVLRQKWCTGLHRYSDLQQLVATFDTGVIAPAEAKRRQLLEFERG